MYAAHRIPTSIPEFRTSILDSFSVFLLKQDLFENPNLCSLPFLWEFWISKMDTLRV